MPSHPQIILGDPNKNDSLWKGGVFPTNEPEWWRNITSPLLRVLNGKSVQATATPADGAASKAKLMIDKPIIFTCFDCQSSNESAEEAGRLQQLPTVATSDQKGNIYVFFLSRNRYTLIGKTGISGTAITFGKHRPKEIFVGLSNNSIQCFNLDTRQVVANLTGYHKEPVHHLMCHPNRPVLISSSNYETIFWDIEKWSRKRVLAGANGFGVQEAIFSPTGSQIATYFYNGSVLLWDTDSFNLLWKVQLPEPISSVPLVPNRPLNQLLLSRDETLMVVSSNIGVPSVFVWNIPDKSLLHEITIPSFQASGGIVEIRSLSDSLDNIIVLSADGQLVIVDVMNAILVDRIKRTGQVKSLSVCGDFVATQSLTEQFSLTFWSYKGLTAKAESGKRVSFLESLQQMDKENKVEEREEPQAADDGKVAVETKKVSRVLKQKPVPPPMADSLQELVKQTQTESILNKKKLGEFLRHFGEFPEKYRVLIWRYLLQLPENRSAYRALAEKVIHPSLSSFRAKFPMKSDRMARSTERIMSSLIYWSPVFENLDYLPSMIFPFVKVFGNDTFACFEVILTIVNNWCRLWWEFYPNPPVQVLCSVEDLLAIHDKPLLDHFARCKVTSQIYAWPILSSMFSDIFSKSEWQIVWDHIFINECDFMYYILVAYLKTFRQPLIQLYKLEDFKFFFNRMSPVLIANVVELAYKLRRKTPKSFSPAASNFQPLPKEHYPIFNLYPEHIVNYQKKLREKIRREEEDYTRKKKLTDEIQKLSEEMRRDQLMWETNQLNKNEMMEKWWSSVLEEEEQHVRHKAEVEAEDKHRRTDTLRSIMEARTDFLRHQQQKAAGSEKTLFEAMRAHQENLAKEDEQEELNNELHQMEDLWAKRRRELLNARRENDMMDKVKVEQFARRSFPQSSN